MIRERINSATIRAVSFDPTASTLLVESKEGTITRHCPVKYDICRPLHHSGSWKGSTVTSLRITKVPVVIDRK